ncbi:S41 family peptidase [Paenibacillus thiaminolyticus]|uniref:S41 family peptidase n=1 Tax=Paenibacillus thiaminolyticus TaxID=49283 RepID=UPI00232E445B|nr:S41 family peptidase [Paenibacillus thiaminolyticus]WCF06545.1 S41 family peptidase [Paenibacillus thiaminolyticus]
MARDLDYLNEIVTEVHPKTYGGVPAEVQQAFRKAYNDVQYVDNVLQFYFLTQQVMNALQDGHSTMLFPDGPRMDNLPFSYAWLEDGIYVTSGSGWLHRGDKIIEFGGRNEQELIKMLHSFLSVDNVYDLKSKVSLSGILTSLPYLQYFGLIEGNQVQLVVERGNEVIEGKLQMKKILKFASPYLTRDRLDYTISKEDDLAVLYIDSFAALDETTKSVIRDFFIDVKSKQVNHVAIDLRFNPGGTTLVENYIMSFLKVDTYRDFKTVNRYSTLTSQYTYDFPFGSEEMQSLDSRMITIPSHEYSFNGQIYVITSFQTYSAATNFAVKIYDNNLGLIVGEPSGSKPSSYGSIILLELPESKLSLSISYKWIERPYTTIKNRYEDVLQPDIYVPTQYEDLVQGRDPQLEIIKKLIREERQNGQAPILLRR